LTIQIKTFITYESKFFIKRSH